MSGASEHRSIAAYLGLLNRTRAKYRHAVAQEWNADSRNVTLAVPDDWPSNHTRVLAYMLATVALGTRAHWGNTL
jgi:hypothetical protein